MILFVVRLVRFLLVLLVLRLLFRFVASVVQGYRRAEARERVAAPLRAVELVRDPVCQTFLPIDRALVATVDGRVQHFCSEACRARALGAPVP